MKRRVIFVDLHCNGFIVKNLSHVLFKHSVALKHDFLLSHLLTDDSIEVCNFVSKKNTCLLKGIQVFGGIWQKIWPHLSCLENLYVMRINRLSSIKPIYSIGDIRPTDIIIGYLNQPDALSIMEDFQGLKTVSLLHFFGETNEALLLRTVNPDVIFSEAYLNKYSKMFQKNFSWYKGEYLLVPFKYHPRFQSKINFSQRKVRAVAMGTVTKRPTKEFVAVYGTDCYQPLRGQIYEHKDDLSDILDCFISPFIEKDVKITSDMSIFQRIYKKVMKLFSEQQKQYFSFDMVEKYNEYKMAICPEDAQGMPGVGFVEAMACGCAYIGLDYGAYHDLGLIEGVHFIGYDGSLMDLRKKIEYYMQADHQEELALIAENGREYVRANFSEDVVAKRFFQALFSISKKEMSTI
ncbi:glycosyltransferase [Selenomonas sputigena]|uniref:glycosyltransferase n=1 Tax=Selenomonas sputigena TaxID=69823 RepID=UPI0022323C90|nr:glycosyltransferase [Selenomonas sputigena]UZD42481.1 glycosyltransferase [Selenomonas sputigena]